MSIINKLKVSGIPFGVTLYLYLIIAIGLALGIPAILGNGLMEAQTVGWGGRELGIAIGAIIAAFSRNATAYFIIFVIGIFRELSDALEALAETPANLMSAGLISAFILIGLICAFYSYKVKRNQ